MTIDHWIDGRPRAGTSGRTAPVHDPATGAQTGEVALASAAEVDAAVKTAAAAAREWRTSSLSQRAAVLFAFRELLHARTDELAAIITAEHGKVLSDAAGEIARGLENVEFATGVPQLLKGGFSRAGLDRRRRLQHPPAARRRRRHHALQLPRHGAAVDVRQRHRLRQRLRPQAEREGPVRRALPRPAVEGGRPARRRLHRRARRQGGRRRDPRPPRRSPRSASSARRRSRSTSTSAARRNGKRVQALGGAKNHALVLPDADIDMAADAIVSAAYGAAGERCMALSVAVAVGDVGDDLVDAIAARLPKLTVGAGRRDGHRHGPAHHRASTATRSPATSSAGEAGRRRRRRRPRAATSRRRASSSARRCSTTSPPR